MTTEEQLQAYKVLYAMGSWNYERIKELLNDLLEGRRDLSTTAGWQERAEKAETKIEELKASLEYAQGVMEKRRVRADAEWERANIAEARLQEVLETHTACLPNACQHREQTAKRNQEIEVRLHKAEARAAESDACVEELTRQRDERDRWLEESRARVKELEAEVSCWMLKYQQVCNGEYPGEAIDAALKQQNDA